MGEAMASTCEINVSTSCLRQKSTSITHVAIGTQKDSASLHLARIGHEAACRRIYLFTKTSLSAILCCNNLARILHIYGKKVHSQKSRVMF